MLLGDSQLIDSHQSNISAERGTSGCRRPQRTPCAPPENNPRRRRCSSTTYVFKVSARTKESLVMKRLREELTQQETQNTAIRAQTATKTGSTVIPVTQDVLLRFESIQSTRTSLAARFHPRNGCPEVGTPVRFTPSGKGTRQRATRSELFDVCCYR